MTRGAVAFKTLKGWRGIESTSDSYPTYLGVQLIEFLRELDNDGSIDLDKMKKDWMARKYDNIYDYMENVETINSKLVPIYTNKNCDPLHTEWVYVIDIKKNVVDILASYETGTTIRPYKNQDHGRLAWNWVKIGSIDWNDNINVEEYCKELEKIDPRDTVLKIVHKHSQN